MTEKPAEYYQDWADRLNGLGRPGFVYDAEFVRETERLSGKPIGEMTREDWDATLATNQAEAAVEIARNEIAIADIQLLRAAMERRNAATMGELFAMLTPDDDDYAALTEALKRFGAVLRMEEAGKENNDE
jgi:crotonobetainyl-CoA:carnitine CoA-transferase CaiB-like acyl-CoA transferase